MAFPEFMFRPSNRIPASQLKRKGRDSNDPCLWRETSQMLIIFRLTKQQGIKAKHEQHLFTDAARVYTFTPFFQSCIKIS